MSVAVICLDSNPLFVPFLVLLVRLWRIGCCSVLDFSAKGCNLIKVYCVLDWIHSTKAHDETVQLQMCLFGNAHKGGTSMFLGAMFGCMSWVEGRLPFISAYGNKVAIYCTFVFYLTMYLIFQQDIPNQNVHYQTGEEMIKGLRMTSSWPVQVHVRKTEKKSHHLPFQSNQRAFPRSILFKPLSHSKSHFEGSMKCTSVFITYYQMTVQSLHVKYIILMH